MADNVLAQARRSVDNSLARFVEERFGLEQGIDRPNVLPYREGEWVAPNWLYEAAKAFALPGHVLRGGDFTVNDVANMALTVGGADLLGGAPKQAAWAARGGPRKAEVGIFAGPSAKTADLFALDEAQKMAKEGMPEWKIWKNTGWFRGKDGKWRFEIDDSASKFTAGTGRKESLDALTTELKEWTQKQGLPHESADQLYFDKRLSHPQREYLDDFIKRWYAAELGQEPPAKLGNVLQHEELYAAYPDMRNIDFDESAPRGYRGAYLPQEDRIQLSNDIINRTQDDRHSTLLHEAQHAVQKREGFAPGGNVQEMRNWRDAQIGEINQYLKALSKRMESISSGYRNWKEGFQDEGKRLAALYDKEMARKSELANLSGEELYKMLAGEVEARNVQGRKDFSGQLRRHSKPWRHEDVPREQQIVKYR